MPNFGFDVFQILRVNHYTSSIMEERVEMIMIKDANNDFGQHCTNKTRLFTDFHTARQNILIKGLASWQI